jgi:hypothetical protein
MKKTKKVNLAILLELILAVSVQAEVITIFDSNATISEGDTYDTVVVKGDGTVVDMTGGDVNSVITMDTGTFNVTGGNIGLESRKPLLSYDSRILNLSGGNIYSIEPYNESRVNISGTVVIAVDSADIKFFDSTVVSLSSENATIPEQLYFYDNSQLNLLSGSVQEAEGYVGSTINITGGAITQMVRSEGRINISGGTIETVYIFNAGVVRIYGGTISMIVADGIMTRHTAEIGIIGYNLSAVPYGGNWGYGQIVGNWNNHTAFSIGLWTTRAYANVKLYDGIIPTDCTNRPDSDLSGDCKVDFIDFSKIALEWLECNLDPPEACWE